jgi:hypothetical protein
MTDRKLDTNGKLSITAVEVEELPLPVVSDWDEQVREANIACRLIDRHLDYEARSQIVPMPRDFQPQDLCPEQRVQLVTDFYAVAH